MKVLAIALLCVAVSQVVLATPVASPAPKAGKWSIPLQYKKSHFVKRSSGGVPLTVDKGSPDLILPGANCKSNCNGHTLYDTDASSTKEDLGKSFNTAMEDGATASGEQYTDTVSIAGLTANGQLNFAWAFGYNLLAIPIAAGILYPIAGVGLPAVVAGIAMAASSVTVMLSSVLLKLYRPPRSH
ncbi:hypothetical protein GQ42DRAFT_159448 [Ramicandelaber brevisporus]|nr:hypothetical protein GQ42DRAFT_159448 [Ramicandelaber brevisporus]